MTPKGGCECADRCTLILGDCRDVLPLLEPGSVDLCLTDPPFPGLVGGHDRDFPGGVAKRAVVTESVGQPWDIGLNEWLPASWNVTRFGAMVFCSFHSVVDVPATIPAAKKVTLGVWYKRNSPPTGKNLPRYTTEFIWMLRKEPGLAWDRLTTTLFDVPLPQGGCMAQERILNPDGTTAHPTQKPLQLIRDLLVVGGAIILDPFAGVGTTLLAAKLLGRRAIGVEIEEKYCTIAANRLKQGVMKLETD